MAQITRSTKIGGGTTLQSNTLARAADVETDILTLFAAHNAADDGSAKWQVGSFENAVSTVVIANNSTGTNNIFEARDNGTAVVTVADGGATTVLATGATSVPLVVNNGTSTGNALEIKDNGTNRLVVADGGTTTITAANGGTDKGLIVNNGTSTGNIIEAQDNGSAVVTIPDGGGINIAKTTNQLILGTTNTTTISATAPSASRVVTLPDPGAAASFVITESAQTVNGVKTFGAAPVLSANAAATPTAGSLNRDAAGGMSWAYVTQAAGAFTLTSDVNIASLSDDGVGLFTLTFATAYIGDDQYAVTTGTRSGLAKIATGRTASTVQITTTDFSDNPADRNAIVNVLIAGKQ
jgi:hypothetical protein